MEGLQYPKKIKQKAHTSVIRYLKNYLSLIEKNTIVL